MAAAGVPGDVARARIASMHGQRLHEGGQAIEKRWPRLLNKRKARIASYRRPAPTTGGTPEQAAPTKLKLAIAAAGAVVVCYVALMLWLMARPARLGHGDEGSKQLPEDLREVKLFRLTFPLFVESGEVLRKEQRSGSTTTTTSTAGYSYRIGNSVHHYPGRTYTTTHAWQYNQYRIALEDGRQVDRDFEDRHLSASPGDRVSLVSSPAGTLVTRNHTTGLTRATNVGIGMPNRRSWLDNVGPLAAAIALVALAHWVFEHRWPLITARDWGMSAAAVAGVWLVLVFVAGIPWLIGLAIINRTAAAQFRSRYVPRIRQFLEGIGRDLAR